MPDYCYGAGVLSRKRNRRAVPEVVAEPGRLRSSLRCPRPARSASPATPTAPRGTACRRGASTTPSWWSGCGSTTCASRAWWSSRGADRRPARPGRRVRHRTGPTARRAGRPPRGRPRGPHRRLHDETVLVTAHSYVDIWQAVRPASIRWHGGSGSSGLRLAGHQAQGAHQLAHQLSLLTRSGQQEPTERAV